MKKLKRVTGIVFALLLVFGMFTALPTKAQAAGKKVTMNVVTSIKISQYGNSQTRKFTYYSNGLLKIDSFHYKTKFVYNSNNLVKSFSTYNGSGTSKFIYSKGNYYYNKGKLTKRTLKGTSNANTWTTTYSYNKSGQVKKSVLKFNDTSNRKERYKYAYDSKGRFSTIVSPATTYKFKYDKNNNIISRIVYSDTESYKNTYKKGLLTKSVSSNTEYSSSNSTRTFKYKKIQVPASLVAKVKAQQHELLNSFETNLDPIAIATAQAKNMKL